MKKLFILALVLLMGIMGTASASKSRFKDPNYNFGNIMNVYLAEFHAGKGHMEQIAELDNQFHHIMYAACGSKMLEHQLVDYHSYVMRIRRKTLSTIERSTASNKEHRAIMEAIRAGKADLAERLANEHMKNAYENMVKNGLYDIYKKTEG